MQFIVIAYDGKDSGAEERRMAARKEHIELGDKMRAEGKVLFGVALLDEANKMVGSVYIVNFSNRDELDQWLKVEPYVVGDVWRDIRIELCKVGPSFEDIVKSAGS